MRTLCKNGTQYCVPVHYDTDVHSTCLARSAARFEALRLRVKEFVANYMTSEFSFLDA